MKSIARIALAGALGFGFVGCAQDEAPADCKLGDLVGTCCTPLNAAGSAMTDRNGAALQGVCNDQNLCQYGANASQVALAQDTTCGNATGLPKEDSGFNILPPEDDAGTGGTGAGGSTGGSGSGGHTGGSASGGTPAADAGPSPGGSATGGSTPPDPCDGVRCPAGAACDPATGRCAPVGGGGMHAGACAGAEECPPGDECIAETPDNRVPGGFCSFDCASDRDCGAGLRCLPVGQTNLCFATCQDNNDCREGWACIELNDGSGGICQPDCNVTGCGAGEVCNAQTSLCEAGCPYACQNGEECTQGHCVRLNHTCATDYHCQVDVEFCHEGQCVPNQGTDCTGNPAACAAAQTCFDNGPSGSLCLFGCGVDEDCPFNEMCYGGISVCWYRFCGDPTDPNGQNGEVLGTCAAGGQAQWEGTCFPIATGDPANPGAPGICFEAGRVQEGGACNAQAEGRDAASRAEQCAAGSICFNDPDDPLDPTRNWDGTGECAGLCDPNRPACNGGRSCLDFSDEDDPATPTFDETRTLGLCVNTDCQVGTGQAVCGAGRQCRPYTLRTADGLCGAAGNAGVGERCTTHADCADEAFCGNPGGGAVCLQTCNADAANPGCPAGQQCVNNGWAYGICLPN